MDGQNGGIFVYGQPESGKKFTIQGPELEDLETQGILPRAVRDVYDKFDNTSENTKLTIKISMIGIYLERVIDLLDPKKLDIQINADDTERNYVENLTERYIEINIEGCNYLIKSKSC